jgi:hypothetical protein
MKLQRADIKAEWFDWKPGVRFLLKAMNKDTISEMQDECLTGKDKHLDFSKFQLKLLKKSIRGWDGLTIGSMLDLMVPIDFIGDKPQLTDVVEYNQENLNQLCELCGMDFKSFFMEKISELPDIHKKRLEEELKNLPIGSAGN